MTKFRVQNYKNVDDTDWVNCNTLTCFVGKNESGKSALFRGLSKINPSDGEKYNGLKEFPRRRYTIDFKKSDWPVSSVEFQLSDAEAEELKKLYPSLEKVTALVCTRHYSWKLDVEFKGIICPDVSWRKFTTSLKAWLLIAQELTAPEGKGDQFSPVKTSILSGLTDRIQNASAQIQNESRVDASVLNEASNFVLSQLTEDWQKETFKKIVEAINQFKNEFEFVNQLDQAKQWVEKKIPKFIYFAEFNVIESAINITDFNQRIRSNPSDPRLRATKCLFEHVGLSLDDVQNLDPTQAPNKSIEELRRMADEREILMSAASTSMTQMFSGWWEQRKHKFQYQVDGSSFRVWVSDNLDPSEIELDQRSQGMQYFFSFYLVFLVEAKDMYSNSIILLDEPALHLHGTAQQQIVKFLAKLSEKNQLLYNTHSPFMIDGDNLENVRVLSEKETDGTVLVSEDVWPKDEDALFPLQAGLGYSIAQTLFYSKRQVIVEGLTDYWLLKAINGLLSEKKMTTLKKDIVIVPCGGVRKLFPLASMLIGNKIKVAILLDGDEAGKMKGKEVKEQLLTKCLFINKYAQKEEAEIEDLLPEKLYLEAVKEAYPDVKVALTFTKEEEKISCISKRVKAAFERMEKDYQKWGPSRIIIDWIQQKPDRVPPETLAKFETLCNDINKILQ